MCSRRYLATTRCDAHVVTLSDVIGAGICRVDFHLSLRCDRLQPAGTARQGAAMPVIENTTGGENQWIFFIWLFGRRDIFNWREQALAASELGGVQNRRSGVVGCGARPLQTAFL